MIKRNKKDIDIATIYQNPKYQGKYVVAIGRKVYSVKSGKAHSILLEKIIKKYPNQTPIVTYIPKEDTLILILTK